VAPSGISGASQLAGSVDEDLDQAISAAPSGSLGKCRSENRGGGLIGLVGDTIDGWRLKRSSY
jgi:hypothetical protein